MIFPLYSVWRVFVNYKLCVLSFDLKKYLSFKKRLALLKGCQWWKGESNLIEFHVKLPTFILHQFPPGSFLLLKVSHSFFSLLQVGWDYLCKMLSSKRLYLTGSLVFDSGDYSMCSRVLFWQPAILPIDRNLRI